MSTAKICDAGVGTMNQFKKWLVENFLPRYAKESLIEENDRLRQELQEAWRQADEIQQYAAGMEYALRHMPGVVVHNHESKNRDP